MHQVSSSWDDAESVSDTRTALTSADVGVAMGGGSAIVSSQIGSAQAPRSPPSQASSSADFILLSPTAPLASLPVLLSLSRATARKVRQNFAWAACFNLSEPQRRCQACHIAHCAHSLAAHRCWRTGADRLYSRPLVERPRDGAVVHERDLERASRVSRRRRLADTHCRP
jgi:hypothetical protein